MIVSRHKQVSRESCMSNCCCWVLSTTLGFDSDFHSASLQPIINRIFMFFFVITHADDNCGSKRLDSICDSVCLSA